MKGPKYETEGGAFRAEAPGWCPTCGQKIQEGDWVIERSGALGHDSCPRQKEIIMVIPEEGIFRISSVEPDQIRIEVRRGGGFELLTEFPAVLLRRLDFNFGR